MDTGLRYCGNRNCEQFNPQPLENFARFGIKSSKLKTWCRFCDVNSGENGLKSCSTKGCSEVNPQSVANFHRRTDNPERYDSRCKTCRRLANKKAVQKYDTANREKRREAANIRQARPGHVWVRRMWGYRVSPERFDAMLDAQSGHCAFCLETEHLEIDHDHSCCLARPTCGVCTRGLLCDRHNRGMGFFTIPEMEKALEYMKTRKAPNPNQMNLFEPVPTVENSFAIDDANWSATSADIIIPAPTSINGFTVADIISGTLPTNDWP